MPIPCVDIVVMNEDEEILLVLRANEPARGRWWFPGGRIYFWETRENAVKRKMLEECGYELKSKPIELGTYDSLLAMRGERMAHGITTLFKVKVEKSFKIQLDSQSSNVKWGTAEYWLKSGLDAFVENGITEAAKAR